MANTILAINISLFLDFGRYHGTLTNEIVFPVVRVFKDPKIKRGPLLQASG